MSERLFLLLVSHHVSGIFFSRRQRAPSRRIFHMQREHERERERVRSLAPPCWSLLTPPKRPSVPSVLSVLSVLLVVFMSVWLVWCLQSVDFFHVSAPFCIVKLAPFNLERFECGPTTLSAPAICSVKTQGWSVRLFEQK